MLLRALLVFLGVISIFASKVYSDQPKGVVVGPCEAVPYAKGIGVGNNNYKGRDCSQVLTQERHVASEEVYTHPQKVQAIESGNSPSPQIQIKDEIYDYGQE